MTGHVISAFSGSQDNRTRSSTVNKSPSESMSFISEVICKFTFTDVHMRNNYHPNRALDSEYSGWLRNVAIANTGINANNRCVRLEAALRRMISA